MGEILKRERKSKLGSLRLPGCIEVRTCGTRLELMDTYLIYPGLAWEAKERESRARWEVSSSGSSRGAVVKVSGAAATWTRARPTVTQQ